MGNKKVGTPQGKHKRYIDANSGLAKGIYITGKAISVKLGRKAFCSRPRRFLNIVEINQLSLRPSWRGTRTASGEQLLPQAARGERPSAGRTAGSVVEERLQAAVRAVARKLCAHTAHLMKYALVTKDTRRSPSA